MDLFTPRFQDCAAKTESQIRSSDINELHSPEEEEKLVERMGETKKRTNLGAHKGDCRMQ